MADELQFSNVVKASLVFRDDSKPTEFYPHVLRVFLRLQNAHDSEITWVANDRIGIHAELLDADGKPVKQPTSMASIQSNSTAHRLPYGSRLDLLISSSGGITLMGDRANSYALIIGSRGWLIPANALETYSLGITVHGIPWTESVLPRERPNKVLLELKPTKITLTK